MIRIKMSNVSFVVPLNDPNPSNLGSKRAVILSIFLNSIIVVSVMTSQKIDPLSLNQYPLKLLITFRPGLFPPLFAALYLSILISKNPLLKTRFKKIFFRQSIDHDI